MQTRNYKLIELFLLFVLIPVSLSLEFSPLLKLILGVLGFIYVLYVLFKVEGTSFKIQKNINWNKFWKTTVLKFIIIALFTTLFVYFSDTESLFQVIRNKPLLWVFILLIYTLFSVYPQEVLYRTFFFKRYQNLFKNKTFLIFFNAVLFSLGHLFFKNSLVIIITFIGGILFAITYQKTKSTVLVSIEHAVYGCWLFTVGMGNMLGFPS